MTSYKKVGTRTPEKINIDLDTIPENESDALCRAVLHGMVALFDDPIVRADYEKWKNEKKLRKEAAAL